MENKVHKFEVAKLGKAPFNFVGLEIRDNKCPDSCKYCGRDIVYCFLVQSSDGNRFLVGSECIRKSGDAGLMDAVKAKKSEIDSAKKIKRMNASGPEIFW